MSAAESGLKRALDVVVSALGLVALVPAWLVIAFAIKMDDAGPVIFVQERSGLRGKVFRCFKFRTMEVGAEQKGRGLEIEKDDPRITRVGALLRRFTLDEIPQLLNVLRGEMSIVGPRPTVPSQVARYTPEQRRRLEARPGMAGWAWIHGRNAIPWERRIEYDIWYVDNWTFALDLKILGIAAWQLVRRKHVYDEDGTVRDFGSHESP